MIHSLPRRATLSLIDVGSGVIRAQHRWIPATAFPPPRRGGQVYAATFSDVVTGFASED